MRAIELAQQRGRQAGLTGGIFYCHYSDTLRQWPQNYCLAVRVNASARWVPSIDRASSINAHSLSIALAQCSDAPTPAALADELTTAFYGSPV